METEEERLEAVRKWWHENGRTVIAGVVVGLGAVFGWTFWQGHLERRAEAASAVYQQLLDSASAAEHADVRERFERLRSEHPGSGYATLGALLAARSAYRAGDAARAEEDLRWAIENATRDVVRDIARLRLARLLATGDDAGGAEALLDAIATEELAGPVAELRGDLADRQGREDAARAEYGAALAAPGLTPGARARIEMKLDELGAADGSA